MKKGQISCIKWIALPLKITILLNSCGHRQAGYISSSAKSADQRQYADTLLTQALSCIYRLGNEKNDIDSAWLCIRQAESINKDLKDTAIRAKIFFCHSNIFRDRGDRVPGQLYIDSAIALLGGSSAHKLLGECYLELSSYYPDYTSSDDMDRKKECMINALPEFEKAGALERQGDVLKTLGDIEQLYNNTGQSVVYLKRALTCYRAAPHAQIYGVYDLLGKAAWMMVDRPAAIRYGRQAVQAGETAKDSSSQMCTIYYRLASSFLLANENDSAEAYLAKALKVALKFTDSHSTYLSVRGLCNSYCRKGEWQRAIDIVRECEAKVKQQSIWDSIIVCSIYTDAYVGQGNSSRAKKYVEKMEGMLDRYGPDNTFDIGIYRCLVRYYTALKEYKMMHRYAVMYVHACQVLRTTDIDRSYLCLSTADSLRGDMNGALAHYKEYKRWADTSVAQSSKMQLTQLQIEYETDQKDKDLKYKQQNIELLTKDNELQNADLKRASFVRNAVIISAGLLLALAFVVYRIQRRHSRKLEAQQEEIHGQNEQLKELLSAQQKLISEKEWLVKEIHHRVKNNLQIIISLLNAQSEFLHDPSALDAIRESRERMQAVALIHQKLYQPDHHTQISIKAYVSEMVSYLSSSFTDISRIRFTLDIDDIDLDVSQSVPLGLILNEAITNAIKYAFPDGRRGSIAISLRKRGEDELLLTISDDGSGFPEHFDFAASSSLGIQLMKLFAEQLEGDLRFRSVNGSEISLLFKRSKPAL